MKRFALDMVSCNKNTTDATAAAGAKNPSWIIITSSFGFTSSHWYQHQGDNEEDGIGRSRKL